MWEVFYTHTGATVAMFANEGIAKRFAEDMMDRGFPVDYDRASLNQAEQFVRDMF
jgi:hypothetical protein